MKLLHVIPGFEYKGGGGNRACSELCESLAALGHEVTIAHVGEKEEQCFRPENVTVKAFPPYKLRGYAYSPILRDYLKSKISEVDLVHIHATWQYPNIPAARYCRMYNVPYVVQPHGNLHPWKLNHKTLRKNIYWHLIEKHILQNAAFIHVESKTDQEDIKRCLPKAKTFISPCGAYSKLFETQTSPGYIKKNWPAVKGKKCLLYLARVDINKGIDLLLEAFAKILESRANYHLLIVGPDYVGTADRMKHICETLRIKDNVTWAGAVTDEERVWIMQDCDVYVLPSLSENFGISVLEALFCSKPVLTTTATPWQELRLKKAGVVTEPNTEGIYVGLKYLLNLSSEELKQMGQNGFQIAKSNYEWHPIASDLADKYKEVLQVR